MIGTNLNAQFDADTDISLNDEAGLATTAEVDGDPNSVALEPGVFANSCIVRRKDVFIGPNLYLNIGTSSSPSWSLLGGSTGIGGSITAGQIAFGDFFTPDTIAGDGDLTWNGTSFLVGTNFFSVNSSNGFTQIKTPNSYLLTGDLDNTGRRTTFNLNDANRQILATINDLDAGNNRRSQVAVYASNAALYFDVFDGATELHRFMTVDSEAVKIGSYEIGGTNRNSNSSLGEISNWMGYGADGMVTRGVIVDAIGSAFVRTDTFPVTRMFGSEPTSGKNVSNWGERHKVRTFNEDADATPFPQDFIVVMRPVNNAVTVTLPAVPATGDQYVVKDGSGTAGTHNITIDGNGNNIEGNPTATISNTYGVMRVCYDEALVQWLII